MKGPDALTGGAYPPSDTSLFKCFYARNVEESDLLGYYSKLLGHIFKGVRGEVEEMKEKGAPRKRCQVTCLLEASLGDACEIRGRKRRTVLQLEESNSPRENRRRCKLDFLPPSILFLHGTGHTNMFPVRLAVRRPWRPWTRSR